MAFVVIYDACVLHPAPLRDLLIRLARTGLVRARWTDQILDETFRSVLRRRPELEKALLRTRELMNAAVDDCLVVGYEPLVESFSLPDPNDRHVVAAAVRAGAQSIVTFNLKDFPAEQLPTDIEALHPDEFVSDLLDLRPTKVVHAVEAQAAALKNPPQTTDDLLVTLEANGIPQSVAQLRELML